MTDRSGDQDGGRRVPTATDVVLAGHSGDVGTARQGLASPDERVRALAVGALGRLRALEPADLVRCLADEAATVRRRTLEEAARLDARTHPELRLAPLLDDEPAVAEVAAWALGERPGTEPGADAALARMARRHPEALCREAAVAALGARGRREGLPAVLDAMTDRATVRRRAVIALAAFDGPEVDEALRRARDDRDRQVRQTAEDLLDE